MDVTDEVYCPALLPLLKNTPLFKLEQFTNDSEDEDDAGSELSTVTVSAKSKETDSKDKSDLDDVVRGKKSENDKLFDDDDAQIPKPTQQQKQATTTAKPAKAPKRHGLVALFKKNAGMSEEEYEGATLSAHLRRVSGSTTRSAVRSGTHTRHATL